MSKRKKCIMECTHSLRLGERSVVGILLFGLFREVVSKPAAAVSTFICSKNMASMVVEGAKHRTPLLLPFSFSFFAFVPFFFMPPLRGAGKARLS
jgi:hypothetical protein